MNNKSRSRVIVIQRPTARDKKQPAFDFGPAEAFGVVEVALPNGRDILTPDIFRVMVDKALSGFKPEQDYIITTGDYSVLFYVGMILGRKFDKIRILRWVRSAEAYQPLTLKVGDNHGGKGEGKNSHDRGDGRSLSRESQNDFGLGRQTDSNRRRDR